jgi:allophanate hydrolase
LAIAGRFRRDGFPSGVTLIAPAGCDERIAAIGAALQAEADPPLGYQLKG